MMPRHSILTFCLLVFCFLLATCLAYSHPTAPDSASAVGSSQTPVQFPEPSQKALEYHASGNILWVVDTLWALLIPAIFLFTGFSSKVRTWSQRLGKNWYFTIVVYFIFFSAIMFVIDLPLTYYEEFVRQHAYDLSNQTFSKWLGDSFKGLMVGVIIGVLFLWVPYMLLKKSPRRWWLYVGSLALPFTVLALLVTPVWIEPLFNDFGPMKDKALEAKILALAERAGIEGGRVYEVNKSVDTKTVNAYVTGFMGTKRIVLWDNAIASFNEKELMFVMGHEMGHYVLGHVWKLIAMVTILSLVTLYLAYRTAGAVIRRFRERFGFNDLADIASLPLVLLLLSFFAFLATPAANWYSREVEHEADIFGLEITQDNHSAATAFVKLQTENLSVPRPGLLYTIWRADHPVLGDRVDFANQYAPWRAGQPLEYGGYFKK